MRDFNYSKIKEQKWDSDVLSLIAAIYKYAGKQELYLKQRPDELEKLVEIAKIQSTESSNAIEGIVTTNTRIRQLVKEKTTPKNRDEEEIAGYRDVLNIIHESFDAVPITEEEFQERVKVENDIEPLYFPYYTYVRSHPINTWNLKTFILRGENDTLCEYDYVKKFADDFNCELTEQKGGEHWFHTDFELDFFRNWLRKRLN